MPLTHKGDTVSIDPVTLYNTDVTAYLKLSGDSVITVTSADPVPIGLMVETMSTLDITVLMPDSNLIAEQHRMNDTTFTYSFVPSRGDSRITFDLTDRFGNTASAAVLVTRTGRPHAQKPLYKELPVRPPSEAAVETTVADKGTVKADTTAAAPPMTGDEVTPESRPGRRMQLPLVAVAPGTGDYFPYPPEKEKEEKRRN